MSKVAKPASFRSPLRTDLRRFLAEKRSCGYRYVEEEYMLRRLDRFLTAQKLRSRRLPRKLVEGWTASRPNERSSTQEKRVILVRQLALFLGRRGIPAYVCPSAILRRARKVFTSRIFSHEEVARILKAADRVPFRADTPLRHIVVPEIFRVLYGCGLRLGEVLRLQVRDVDIAEGILTVREGKFRKDRLVPMADSLTRRLRRFTEDRGPRESQAPFFPNPRGGHYSNGGLYCIFRQLLQAAGIPHQGRGRGPRIHEFRHSFAVHRLERWYREGTDLNTKLPLLASYMGHRDMAGTQEYLQLTECLFTGLATRLEAAFGRAIPRRKES